MVQYVVINADDFGLTEKISDAIVEIFLADSLSSTTLMANTPGFNHAVALAHKHTSLGVGLHFNLTEGHSLSISLPTLTDSGNEFFPRNTLLKKCLLRKINQAEVLAELKLQFEKLEQNGIAPTHIDSHQHIHTFPVIADAVDEFSKSKNIKVRYPQINSYYSGMNVTAAVKSIRKQIFSSFQQQPKLKLNDSFNSVFDLIPYHQPLAADYYFLLQQAKGNIHELMVHPYILSEELFQFYKNENRYAYKKDFFEKCVAEYEAMKNRNLKKWMSENMPEAKWVHFGEIKF